MVQWRQEACSLQVAESAGVTWRARASHVSYVTHWRQQDSFFSQSTAQPTHSNEYDKKQLIIHS